MRLFGLINMYCEMHNISCSFSADHGMEVCGFLFSKPDTNIVLMTAISMDELLDIGDELAFARIADKVENFLMRRRETMKIDEALLLAVNHDKCVMREDCPSVKIVPLHGSSMPLTIMPSDNSRPPSRNWNPTIKDLISDKWVVTD